MARAGLGCSTKRTFWGERQVFERTYQPPSAAVLPHATHLAQTDLEALMYEACQASGVEFAWNQEVTAARADEAGVLVEVAGERSWRAGYVVRAGPARRPGRRLAKLLPLRPERRRQGHRRALPEPVF